MRVSRVDYIPISRNINALCVNTKTLFTDLCVNLRVPDDYQIHWIGHIPFEEFARRFVEYPSHFIPKGNNMDLNQPGGVFTKLQEKLEAIDRRRERAITEGTDVPRPSFGPLIEKGSVEAGLLLVSMKGGRPIGGACYYYPPYAMWETALYVLPSDLHPMDTL